MVKILKKKTEEKIISYFSNKKKLLSIYNFINQFTKITLLTHYKPDGDGISGCAALSNFFKKLNKKIEVIYPNKPLFQFKRNPENILINIHKQIPEILIVLDTANYERFYYPKEFYKIPIINIDHHVSNHIKGTYNLVIPNASSTCEILYFLLHSWNKKLIDKHIAECLLFGILYDTQIFHTQSVYPHTLKTAAELMEYGAKLFELKTELISNKNPTIIKLWGETLTNVHIEKKGKVAWAVITQKDLKKYNLKLSSLIGFNNFLSQLSNVDITIFFYQTEKKQTKVSLRSKKADVNKLASKFGGGGHKNAAGILSDQSISKLAPKIIQAIKI
ncbi:hypothetical protein GF322_00870 [Candidatus Dependentiae bacterium]|nr:hypothetical protein [Candidatus Dependentiae bacterium]